MSAEDPWRAAAAAFGLTAGQARRLMPPARALRAEEGADAPDDSADDTPPSDFPLDPAQWPRLLSGARLLAAAPSELTTHPSGVVLTTGPAEDCLPLEPRGRWRVAQLDKRGCERVELAKIDLLSSGALTVVADAAAHLRAMGEAEAAAAPP